MAVGKTIKCPNCDYQYNFQRWEKCKICQEDLPEDQLVIVFLDIERARGSGSSDPIQFGLLKYCFQRRQVLQKEEINIWTDEDIESWVGLKVFPQDQQEMADCTSLGRS